MLERQVGDLEVRLAVDRTWAKTDPKYNEVLAYTNERDFHRAVDKLQGLVVQRLFEMSKANVAGMGEFVYD